MFFQGLNEQVKQKVVLFSQKEVYPAPPENKTAWKVLIVDDEKDVHDVTRMVLRGFRFEGKHLELLSAYSEKEAHEMIQKHDDLAVILLDVVMERKNSGLEVVNFIRNTVQNSEVRIVLRTGYPGAASEEKVVVEYAINDYRDKSELTAQKFFSLMVTSLRAYNELTKPFPPFNVESRRSHPTSNSPLDACY